MTAITEKLDRSFKTIGQKNGYDIVGTEFAAFKDFKVQWTRKYRCIDFKVSDYLMDAPQEVIEDLAETIFSRIVGGEPKPYSKAVSDWVLSDEFVQDKQPVYLRRSQTITKSSAGESKELQDSLARLKKLGLVEKDANPYLTWTSKPLSTTTGYCSTLMNVIAVSSIFDSECIPDYVIDYAMYHECLVIREGKAHFGKGDFFSLSDEMERFPKWEQAEDMIGKMCLHT